MSCPAAVRTASHRRPAILCLACLAVRCLGRGPPPPRLRASARRHLALPPPLRLAAPPCPAVRRSPPSPSMLVGHRASSSAASPSPPPSRGSSLPSPEFRLAGVVTGVNSGRIYPGWMRSTGRRTKQPRSIPDLLVPHNLVPLTFRRCYKLFTAVIRSW
nr:homeobox protein Hox-A3-like [Aegilops tauschii subsp. strangulata]